ncbi:hypothetical protein C6341_g17965 [Phytophthora cactorum]|nr:hypothetical protein C6341_g17965 [Phytophthora cactorum]
MQVPGSLRVPIVGNTKYGGRRADRLYLHAKRIRFCSLLDSLLMYLAT